MSKEKFLTELKKRLSGLPQQDLDERLSFYGEMIDDRMEEGLSESDAVAEIGPIDSIVSQIIEETPITRIVKERIRPKRNLHAGEITLIVLGFPLWFPLLITFFAVLLSAYAVILSLIVVLWAVEISVLAGALGGTVLAVIHLIQGGYLSAIAILGIAFLLAGISLFAFYACLAGAKGILYLTKRAILGIKTRFVKKESVK